MIGYFPTPYQDELLYSQLARYFSKSGYLAYTFAAQNLYSNKLTKPSIEFLNELSSEALQIITQITPIETIVEKHTMFPYYARFLNKERRNKAFAAMVNMKDEYYNLLCIPKSKNCTIRHLRYCPVCASEDRATFGETFWHRAHQLIGVNICPSHLCQLNNTDIEISSKPSPSLITAEETIPYSEKPMLSDNIIECRVAQYVAKVFSYDVDFAADVPIGSFLHSKMEGTKYLSQRGEQRNMSLLYADFCKYYNSLPSNQFNQQWQLQKVLSNHRHNTYEICLLAMLLNVSGNELISLKLPTKSQQQFFDEQIITLHRQGLNYQQIANRLNASYNVVKAIGEGLYGTYHYYSANPQKGGSKKFDWQQVDAELLPKVQKIIDDIQSNTTSRPQKITVGTVERLLKLPKKKLKNCPKCRAEIMKHFESQEIYWARVVVWAAKKIISEGQTLTYTRIYNFTNLRKKNLTACKPYIGLYAPSDLSAQISSLI